MSDVRREIDEERFVLVLADETYGLVEKYIGAIALEFLGLPVAVIGVVEVVVAPIVRDLSYCATPQTDHIIEALVLGTHGPVVAEVPLAELPGRVTIVLECLRNGISIAAHHGTAEAGTPCAGLLRILTGHQTRARRRAHRHLVEVSQADRLLRQLVDMGRCYMRIPLAPNVVPLVVGHDDNDVWPVRIRSVSHCRKHGTCTEYPAPQSQRSQPD